MNRKLKNESIRFEFYIYSMFVLNIYYFCKNFVYRHAVSRKQRGKQREPSVKTLRSPLSEEFIIVKALHVEYE